MNKVAIGLDVGYGELKASSGEREDQNINVSSVIHELTKKEEDALDCPPDFHDEKGSFLVGKNAVNAGSYEFESPDSGYTSSSTYRIMSETAINRLAPNKESKIFITTGLPVSFMAKSKSSLEKTMRGLGGGNRVVSVQIVPQPLGTIINLTHDWAGKATDDNSDLRTKRVAVIDIGHGTLDMVEVVGMKTVPSKVKGHTIGVHEAQRFLLADIDNAKTLGIAGAYTIHQMADALRKGTIDIRGVKTDISKYTSKAKEHLAKQVIQRMRENWGQSMATIYRIIFTGGGSALIEKQLMAAWDRAAHDQILFPTNPGMANVHGFAKVSVNTCA